MMKLSIGIDTGGTYTDAVLYDFENEVVLGHGKALTTHDNLKTGILNALDALDPALCCQAEIAGLSTTLATNACVEGKFRHTRLLLMGIDRTGISRFGADYGFTDPDAICYLPCRTTITGKILEEPDWDSLRANAQDWFGDAEGCAVCELNGVRNGGVLEAQAARILSDEVGIPAVQASSLFGGLSSLERSASALLNAGLLPIMEEFLEAVKAAFSSRGIRAKLFVVRSDGSLMDLHYARNHAVETILSGPAASALGGSILTRQQQAVIVDMGGTTTDVALVQNGAPLLSKDGTRVGGWKTQVHSVFATTVALGGDSAIHWDQNGVMSIGPNRILPLCVLAKQHPEILPVLREQVRAVPAHTLPLHEFLVLNRPNWASLPMRETDKQLCRALENGPLSFQQAADAIGVDRYYFSSKTLEDSGVILRAGLTPTDIMHILGDYTTYEREASVLGGKFAASSLGVSEEALCARVYERVSKEVFFAIARTLLEQASPHFHKHGSDKTVQALLDLQWQLRNVQSPPLLNSLLQTSATLVGVGGPIHLFLPEAAKALKANYEIPPYAAVANAVGAVAGQMTASATAEIRTCEFSSASREAGNFEVLCESHAPRFFPDEPAAAQWAKEALRTLVDARIRARGGTGTFSYQFETTEMMAPVGVGTFKLGTRIQLFASTHLPQMKDEP